jgi:hypothetical protein
LAGAHTAEATPRDPADTLLKTGRPSRLLGPRPSEDAAAASTLATNTRHAKDMSVQPFDISVPQVTLEHLRERLARTRFPDEVSGS